MHIEKIDHVICVAFLHCVNFINYLVIDFYFNLHFSLKVLINTKYLVLTTEAHFRCHCVATKMLSREAGDQKIIIYASAAK